MGANPCTNFPAREFPANPPTLSPAPRGAGPWFAIRAHNLHQAMGTLGEAVTLTECQAMIAAADTDGKGYAPAPVGPGCFLMPPSTFNKLTSFKNAFFLLDPLFGLQVGKQILYI